MIPDASEFFLYSVKKPNRQICNYLRFCIYTRPLPQLMINSLCKTNASMRDVLRGCEISFFPRYATVLMMVVFIITMLIFGQVKNEKVNRHCFSYPEVILLQDDDGS